MERMRTDPSSSGYRRRTAGTSDTKRGPQVQTGGVLGAETLIAGAGHHVIRFGVAQADQLFGVRDRERVDQHAVDRAEEGGAGADTYSEGEHDHCSPPT